MNGGRLLSGAALLLSGLAMVLSGGCAPREPIDYSGPVAGWGEWGGSDGGLRYSPLTQINRRNVGSLQVAWTYRIGDVPAAAKVTGLPALEATPILADGRLYLCSAVNKVVALDPESGRELWSYDPHIQVKGHYLLNCRGVTFYTDKQAAAGAACASRIFTGTTDGRLIALDAATGKPCEDFGTHGSVDLLAGLGKISPGIYSVSSPPVVIADRVVLGGRILDNFELDVPSGVVRAYDVHTGTLSWAWDTLPPGRSADDFLTPQQKAAGVVYARSTSNAWSVFSVDRERNLIFVPTGNPQPDLYGAHRNELDHYSSSVVALRADTGEVAWHYQTVHHDLWDYDVPAQPVLFDFPTEHGPVPAIAQATKQGYIYILNREDGTPLVSVEERPAPQAGALPEEQLAPTQPIPTGHAYSLYPGDLSEQKMWGFTPWDRAKCIEQFRAHRYEGLYTPPSLEGTVTFPYNNGIMNWGAVSIDPERNILVTNSTRIASIVTLVPRKEADARMKKGEFLMPAVGSPYAFDVKLMFSPLGAPCNPPPWGALTAIDMKAGAKLWEIPLGTTRDIAPFPLWFSLGVPNIGGSLLTGSGLVFIAATTDSYFRAFDIRSGEKLWEERLPAGGQATPMTYRLRPDGKQYIVIAAGGHKYLRSRLGDYFVAYTLRD